MDLPEDVPPLPPGFFYRIRHDTLLSGTLVVQIRQKRGRFSKRIVEKLTTDEGMETGVEWIISACTRAFEAWEEDLRENRVYLEASSYFGDHHY